MSTRQFWMSHIEILETDVMRAQEREPALRSIRQVRCLSLPAPIHLDSLGLRTTRVHRPQFDRAECANTCLADDKEEGEVTGFDEIGGGRNTGMFWVMADYAFGMAGFSPYVLNRPTVVVKISTRL